MYKHAFHGPVTTVELFPPDRPNLFWNDGVEQASNEKIINNNNHTINKMKKCLLVGTGPKLRIYSLSESKKMNQLIVEYNVLPSAIVHGIRFSCDLIQIAVFGQKFCNVYNFQYSYNKEEKRYDNIQLELLLHPNIPHEFSDLILDVQFLHDEHDQNNIKNTTANEVGLIFSHNFVEIWSLNPFLRKYHIKCADHCILYSAKFFGYSYSSLIVASGTVFNQILIWDPLENRMVTKKKTDTTDDDGIDNTCVDVKYRLEGHKGVLFHIDWDIYGDQLISVSDDRTLRCWELTTTPANNNNNKNNNQALATTINAMKIPPSKLKSEIFNKNNSNNKTYQFINSWTAFGHSARVWKCKFFNTGIITCAEDASAIVWDRNGSIITRLSGHAVKNVWCATTSWNGAIAISGGGDGSVKLWDLKKYEFAASIGHTLSNKNESTTPLLHNNNINNNNTKLEERNILKYISSNDFHSSEEGSKSQVLLLSKFNENVYATSNFGHVSCCNVNDNEKPTTYFCTKNTHAKAISCTLALSPDEKYLIAGDRRGFCRVVYTSTDATTNGTSEKYDSTHTSYLLEWQAHKTRCWQVYWGGSRPRMGDPTCSHKMYDTYRIGHDEILLKECVVTTSATGELSVWHIFSMENNKFFEKPMLLGSLKTYGKSCFSSIYFGTDYLFCGDNRGTIYVSPTSATIASDKHVFPPNNETTQANMGGTDEKMYSQWLSVIVGGHNHQPVRWTGFHINTYYSAGHDGYIVEYCKSINSVETSLSQGSTNNDNDSNNNNNNSNSTSTVVANRSFAVKCIHKAAPITAVESIWWSKDSKSMIVIGTKASDLIIYNMTKKYELLRIEIGGWRRPVDIMPLYDNNNEDGQHSECKLNKFLIAFVPPGRSNPRGQGKAAKTRKAEIVCISKFDHVCNNEFVDYSLESSFHGKVATGVKWICSSDYDWHGKVYCKVSYAITCAEDNRLKILKITSHDTTRNQGNTKTSKRNLVGSNVLDTWISPSFFEQETISSKNNNNDNTTIDCLQTVEMHHSGVRALEMFQSTHQSIIKNNIVVSVGGNNTICCWRVSNDCVEYGKHDSDDTGSSYISLLARKTFASKDGDYRFLSVTALPNINDSDIAYIFVGNSQGYVYCFLFSEKNAFVNDNMLHKRNTNNNNNNNNSNSNNEKKKKNIEYNRQAISNITVEHVDGSEDALHNDTSVLKLFHKFKQDNPRQVSPVLDIGSFIYENNETGKKVAILISGGSNGTLSLWSFVHNNKNNENGDPLQRLLFHDRVHQCGMNCLDYSKKVDENNCFVVVSGGDDNMFAANIFQITTESNNSKKYLNIMIVKLKSFNLNNFCASALKGIRLVDNYIFCAGWNQRLHVGKLNYNIVKKGKDNSAIVVVETINLEMVGMSFVDVADVGDLDVQHELSTNMDNFGRRGDDAGAMFHVLVVGQGIEYVRYVV